MRRRDWGQQRQGQRQDYYNREDQRTAKARKQHYPLLSATKYSKKWLLILQGGTGTYQLTLSTTLACTCESFNSNQKSCKHLLSIPIKILKCEALLHYFENQFQLREEIYGVVDGMLTEVLGVWIGRKMGKGDRERLGYGVACGMCFQVLVVQPEMREKERQGRRRKKEHGSDEEDPYQEQEEEDDLDEGEEPKIKQPKQTSSTRLPIPQHKALVKYQLWKCPECSKYLHQSCLQKWTKISNPNPEPYSYTPTKYTCPICKFDYGYQMEDPYKMLIDFQL